MLCFLGVLVLRVCRNMGLVIWCLGAGCLLYWWCLGILVTIFCGLFGSSGVFGFGVLISGVTFVYGCLWRFVPL